MPLFSIKKRFYVLPLLCLQAHLKGWLYKFFCSVLAVSEVCFILFYFNNIIISLILSSFRELLYFFYNCNPFDSSKRSNLASLWSLLLISVCCVIFRSQNLWSIGMGLLLTPRKLGYMRISFDITCLSYSLMKIVFCPYWIRMLKPILNLHSKLVFCFVFVLVGLYMFLIFSLSPLCLTLFPAMAYLPIPCYND